MNFGRMWLTAFVCVLSLDARVEYILSESILCYIGGVYSYHTTYTSMKKHACLYNQVGESQLII